MEVKKSRRQNREEVIQVLYRFELFNEKIDAAIAFQEFSFLSNEQVKFIEKIDNNYDFLKSIIAKFLNQNWAWLRIPPLIKAILINASAELFTIPPRIVINEAVEITKDYFCMTPDDDKYYKFVNAILQNVYKAIVALESNQLKDEKDGSN
ncbi:transcription antitermination protein NusB [Mycoplasma crocodyli]|uniref:Transcription anti-termination factor NusB n=1 Tax=Mycoplasma crocodyli (strain ATCC 51981 / MP145) TaxID=512564 RepID=D5E5F5_MYCCM|nr:transcription antitermination protein NusB [Mycoplasma crocodyli]ADE19556.1 transcription anti-termination factor NusB [Mycoplasma crocodyli MP145]